LDSNNDLWVGTSLGAAKWQSGQWKIYNTDSGLINNQVYDIVRQNNTLWFITSGGVSRLTE